MEMKKIKKDSAAWVENSPSATPEASYEEHLQDCIARGKAQLDAGQGIPADQVWEELGIE